MAIITFTTDMGHKDHYVAVVKAALYRELPEARMVDISHGITPFNNAEAAFVLRSAWPAFPEGSIHIIGVNPESGPHEPHVVVRHQGHYFVGTDNGIFSLLFEGQPHEAWELNMKLDDDHATFPVRSVFAKVAAHLARGGKPEVIGRQMAGLREQIGFQPATDANSIRGKVVHIDHYGNVITNIRRRLFDDIGGGRNFRIGFGRPGDAITRLDKRYGDVPSGEKLAFFGENGLLEIAVNRGAPGVGGGFSQLFGVQVEDPVRVDFR